MRQRLGALAPFLGTLPVKGAGKMGRDRRESCRKRQARSPHADPRGRNHLLRWLPASLNPVTTTPGPGELGHTPIRPDVWTPPPHCGAGAATSQNTLAAIHRSHRSRAAIMRGDKRSRRRRTCPQLSHQNKQRPASLWPALKAALVAAVRARRLTRPSGPSDPGRPFRLGLFIRIHRIAAPRNLHVRALRLRDCRALGSVT